MKRLNQEKLYLLIAILIAAAAALPLLWGGGLLNTRGGGDSPFLIQRLHQLTTAVYDGHFPVRWMPDANYGYGYPFFNFYAPLAFYVALFFRLLGFGTIRAIQLSQLCGFVVAGWGMYRLGVRWFKRPSHALLASAAYTFAPFHLVNVYVRGDSIAEFWAMAFYPLVIWATDCLITADTTAERRRQVVILALAYGGLVISHNISAMIFSPFVVLYGVGRVWHGRYDKTIYLQKSLNFSAAILLGVAASAWFWLPAIGEQSLTQLSEITVGYFDYNFGDGFHFRSTDLVQSSFFYDPDVGNGDAFRMGLVQAFLIGLSLVAYGWHIWRTKSWSVQTLTLISGLLVATFMMHPWSRILWDTLPLLPYTQFPWRFLSVQAFWGAALTPFILTLIPERPSLSSIFYPLLFIALLAIAAFGRFQLDYLIVAENDITGESIAQYEWFTGNIGTTISAEYLSNGVSPRPYTSAWLQSGQRWTSQTIRGQASTILQTQRTQEQIWQIEVTSPQATVTLPLMYWPGWQATNEQGEALSLNAAAGSGLAQLSLDEGTHLISLKLGRTPVRIWGELISLITLLALGGYLFRQRSQFHRPNWTAEPKRVFAVVLCIMLVVVLGNRLEQTVSRLHSGVRSWDFGLMGFLHYDGEILFGNQAVLADVAYNTAELTAGDTVEITLDWSRAAEGGVREATLSLVTPANNFFNNPEPIAQQTRPLIAGQTTYQLTIPSNAPAGLYVPHLTLNDRNRPRTPSENKRGFLYFAPLRVLNPAIQADLPAQTLEVRPISVTHLPPRVLHYQLAWYTAQPLPQPYMMSLRLTDLVGQEIHQAQLDTQFGYGQQPSHLWSAGEWVDVWTTVNLPEGELPFPPPYVAIAKIYDPTDGRVLLTRRLGQLESDANNMLKFIPHTPNFTLPENITELEARFATADGTEIIALRGYELIMQDDETADITLYWEVLGSITADYYHFVHLLDPETGQPLRQHDSQPRNNTYPTSQWQAGEIIADTLTLDLSEVAEDRSYRLTAGLYEITADGYPRLAVWVEDGAVENNAILLQMVR